MSEVIKEIDNYLQAGGMFNPEEMEPHKVRDLLMKCRIELNAMNIALEMAVNDVNHYHDKIDFQDAEIERLKEKCDKQAYVIRRSYPENFPDTWFVANGIGQKDENNLPQYIWVCPAFGVDWLQVYEKTERTVGGMGS